MTISINFLKEDAKEGLLLILGTTLVLTFLDHTHFKGIEEEDDRDLFSKVKTRLYFSMTTLSTVGYGDIVPKSDIARSITIIMQLMIMLSIRNWFGKY